MTFVTVEDVDAALGVGWATAEQKAPAVAEANVWLIARLVSGLDPIPGAVVSAGCLLARESAEGRLYADNPAAIKRKRTRVEGAIDTETEYAEGAVAVSGVMQQVADLLKPYLSKRSATRILARL